MLTPPDPTDPQTQIPHTHVRFTRVGSLLHPEGRFSIAATAKESMNEETPPPPPAGITTSRAVV